MLDALARTRRTLRSSRRSDIANGLIRFIPGDSVKFWMFENVCHASVYHILYFLPAGPNKLYSCRTHCLDQVLDMF